MCNVMTSENHWAGSCSNTVQEFLFWKERPSYRPPTKLWKGNIFRSVCHSVHGGGEGVSRLDRDPSAD